REHENEACRHQWCNRYSGACVGAVPCAGQCSQRFQDAFLSFWEGFPAGAPPQEFQQVVATLRSVRRPLCDPSLRFLQLWKLCRAGTRRLCLTATHCAYLSEEQGDQDRSVGEWRNARDNDHALLTAVPSRHDGDMPIGAGGFAIKQKRWPNNAGPAFAGPFCRTACSLSTRPSPAVPAPAPLIYATS